jgi:hypothetical protein
MTILQSIFFRIFWQFPASKFTPDVTSSSSTNSSADRATERSGSRISLNYSGALVSQKFGAKRQPSRGLLVRRLVPTPGRFCTSNASPIEESRSAKFPPVGTWSFTWRGKSGGPLSMPVVNRQLL